MSQNQSLAKSQNKNKKEEKHSCNKCKGYGLIKRKHAYTCNHCYNSEKPLQYTICCYCENVRSQVGGSTYQECNECLGMGEK